MRGYLSDLGSVKGFIKQDTQKKLSIKEKFNYIIIKNLLKNFIKWKLQKMKRYKLLKDICNTNN